MTPDNPQANTNKQDYLFVDEIVTIMVMHFYVSGLQVGSNTDLLILIGFFKKGNANAVLQDFPKLSRS